MPAKPGRAGEEEDGAEGGADRPFPLLRDLRREEDGEEANQQVVSILISAVIALAALWGYNIVVVQPMAEQVAEQVGLAEHGRSLRHAGAGRGSGGR